MKRRLLITIFIVILVVIVAIVLINYRKQETSESIARCIGRNAVLYMQLGCHACEIQENLFGESYQYLNRVDCFYQREKCSDIQKTPTWIIKGKKYEGVLSIEKLQELTGC